MWNYLREVIIVFVAKFFFNLLSSTWKKKELPLPDIAKNELAQGRPVVFAHFHQDEWALLGFYRKKPVNVLISHSKDGSMMARYLKSIGFGVARGSSSRGGAMGFRNLLKMVETSSNKIVSLAMDGPRGPYGVPKKGIFALARLLKAPLVLSAAEADKKWIFRKSWSAAFIPKPFASITLEHFDCLPYSEIEKNDDRTLQKIVEDKFAQWKKQNSDLPAGRRRKD